MFHYYPPHSTTQFLTPFGIMVQWKVTNDYSGLMSTTLAIEPFMNAVFVNSLVLFGFPL